MPAGQSVTTKSEISFFFFLLNSRQINAWTLLNLVVEYLLSVEGCAVWGLFVVAVGLYCILQ